MGEWVGVWVHAICIRYCMEVSGQLHTPSVLPSGNRPWYPLDRRLGGPQLRCGRCEIEKNLLLSCCPALSLISVLNYVCCRNRAQNNFIRTLNRYFSKSFQHIFFFLFISPFNIFRVLEIILCKFSLYIRLKKICNPYFNKSNMAASGLYRMGIFVFSSDF
jgi:hypothetical protein